MDEETLMHCYFFIFDNLLLLSNDSVSQAQLFSADSYLTDWSFYFSVLPHQFYHSADLLVPLNHCCATVVSAQLDTWPIYLGLSCCA